MTPKRDANDGGPAYPSARDMRYRPDFDHEPGMTLRDHFAGLAMLGLTVRLSESAPADTIAGWAYQQADAMLRARENGA